VRTKLQYLPDDPALALAQAIGVPTMADFVSIGDSQSRCCATMVWRMA